MNPLRRHLLGGTAATLLLPLLAAGLLRPSKVLASESRAAGFAATTLAEALRTQATGNLSESRDIQISAPEIAENGAKVIVEISSTLSNVRSLAVFADKNPQPLCATLDFAPQVQPYARLELKLAESTRLRALMRTVDGKNLVAFRDVKVTQGGCGG